MIKVLFVCMGNICRSPTAHGVFQGMVNDAGLSAAVYVDSAGTHSYHIGSAPDLRSQKTAQDWGVDISTLSARCIVAEDFDRFDYILAMDSDNLSDMQRIAPAKHAVQLCLFLDYAPDQKWREVPDPYYGGDRGFDNVFQMITQASTGLLENITKKL